MVVETLVPQKVKIQSAGGTVPEGIYFDKVSTSKKIDKRIR